MATRIPNSVVSDRVAPRTRAQAQRLLEDLLAELDDGRIAEAEVVSGLSLEAFALLTEPSLTDVESARLLTTGRVAAPGAAVGRIHLSVEDLLADDSPEPKLLACRRISNRELCQLGSIAGILAESEDSSSHAVIASRSHGTPILTDLELVADPAAGTVRLGDTVVAVGERIAIDSSGSVYQGRLEISTPERTPAVRRLMDLLVLLSPVEVYANADNGVEATLAAEHWAVGYEPRTEHMLLQEDRLRPLQRALLAAPGERDRHLPVVTEHLRAEVLAMYRASAGHPVHIRLLDPPIHEFVPVGAAGRARIADDLGVTPDELEARIAAVSDVNPMMGMRGVRLLVMRPEIVRAQALAIFHAALDHAAEVTAPRYGPTVPHITVPMIVDASEVALIRAELDRIRDEVSRERRSPLEFRLGIMIETPRAALLAERLAPHVDYISFGTNDLTAQVFAFSRGDVFGKFLSHYLAEGLLPADPFTALDDAVKILVATCVKAMREHNPAVHIGVCGEQAGHPDAIEFVIAQGIDSIAVAPKSVPAALFHAARSTQEGS